jgi:hypothetical protein
MAKGKKPKIPPRSVILDRHQAVTGKHGRPMQYYDEMLGAVRRLALRRKKLGSFKHIYKEKYRRQPIYITVKHGKS